MIELTFHLTFSSDWHISSSTGKGHEIDSTIERDPNNDPYVRGATLKGLFRESLLDMQLFPVFANSNYPPDPDLLGRPGIECEWSFSDAKLKPSPNGKNNPDRTVVTTGVRVDPRTRRADEGKFFRREMGGGDTTFEFKVQGFGQQEDVEWLIVAACYIRRLGNRRRRGAGACHIQLVNNDTIQAELLHSFEQRQHGQHVSVALPEIGSTYTPDPTQDARRFRLILKTDSHVVIASKPEAGNHFAGEVVIPGRTIRGTLAKRAFDFHHNPADVGFATLFYRGGARFSPLLPTIEDSTTVSLLPMGISQTPAGDLVSALTHEPPQGSKKYSGKYYPLSVNEDKAQKTAISMATKMHTRIDNTTKRASTGELYSYDAIPPEQYYVGEVVLDADWSLLGEQLQVNVGQPFEVLLGKGRRRGYGKCTIWLEPISNDETPAWCYDTLENRLNKSDLLKTEDDNVLYTLSLASDAILLDDFGRSIQTFDEPTLREILGIKDSTESIKVKIENVMVQTTQVDGFDLRSGLPTWRDLALAKGSSVAFKTNIKLDPAILHDLEKNGIGLRRSEGFGRVVFNHPAHFSDPVRVAKLAGDPSELLEAKSFIEGWRDYLDEQMDREIDRITRKSLFGQDQYRILARHLLEKAPLDVNAAQEMMTELEMLQADRFGLPPSYAQARNEAKRLGKRTPRFSDESKNFILQLLENLQEDYPAAYWQTGIVVLAQAVNDAVNAAERAKRS
jgi:CRISPR-associated protein Csx10